MMTHPALRPHAMLRTAIAVIALSIAPQASAEATPFETRLCQIVTRTAEQAMVQRQRGKPMDDLIEATFGLCDDAPTDACRKYVSLARSMVRQAYEVPDYHTPENEALAVASFAAEWRVFCANTLYKD